MSVIIYQDHIEVLEEENLLLKQEIFFLKKQLEYKSLGLPYEKDDGKVKSSIR